MGGCVVHKCRSKHEKEAKGIKFFRIPSGKNDTLRRRAWLCAVKKTEKDVHGNSRVCELHFGPDDWEKVREDGTRKLKSTAVPSLNLMQSIIKARTPLGNNNASPSVPSLQLTSNISPPSPAVSTVTHNDSEPEEVLHDHCYISQSFVCSTPMCKVSRPQELPSYDFNSKAIKESRECPTLKSEIEALRAKDCEECSSLRAENKELVEQLTNLQLQLQHKDGMLLTAQKNEAELRKQILQLKGKIRVFVRVRPRVSHEANKSVVDFKCPEISSVEIIEPEEGSNKVKKSLFNYDRVFVNSSQSEVYEEVYGKDRSDLVLSTLEGHNVCIPAYGPTGSGKTFTIRGGSHPETAGVVPCSICPIFEHIKNENDDVEVKEEGGDDEQGGVVEGEGGQEQSGV